MDREESNGWRQPGYCWIGTARYTQPLDSTAEKKWRLLGELGITMYVISFSTSLRPRRFHQHARFYLLPQAGLPLLRYLTVFFAAPFLALWLIFRHGVGVLVAQSPYEGAAGACAKTIARLFGRRVTLIVESHGDFAEAVFLQRRVSFAGLYRQTMGRSAAYALHHADALRTISRATSEQLQALAPDKPTVQFMAWTDVDVFLEAERVPLSQTHDVIYAGVLTPLKGVHFLIEAFARAAADMPDAHLWLVGRAANPDYVSQLKQQVQQLSLYDRVTFTGEVSQRELAGYMARGRVLVLPSVSEGLGRVVVEAMLCGTPVVASRVGGIPELIEDGVTGYLVPPDDVNALAEALRAMLQSDVEAIGQRARDFARRFCSNEAYIDGYRRLFEMAYEKAAD